MRSGENGRLFSIEIPPRTAYLFQEAKKRMSLQEIADSIGLHVNTVKRWEKTDIVPSAYEGDFLRMSGRDGDVSPTGDHVRDKDQFYTKPETARLCYAWLQEAAQTLEIDLGEYWHIEPSAGEGVFYNLMPPDRRIGVDIDPRGAGADQLIQADYLRWSPNNSEKRYVVFGNPPFGLRGHLALQFINHSVQFADLTAFVLPQLFESDGKGVPAKRVDPRYRRVLTKRLPADSFITSVGREVSVSAIFQVWSKVNLDRLPREKTHTCSSYASVYSLSDGGTPASTRNKKMLHRCDVYLPSTCFTGMRAYESFEELPHRRGYGVVFHREKETLRALLLSHDWEKTAFFSTNGAMNLRTSLILKVMTSAGFYDPVLNKPAD